MFKESIHITNQTNTPAGRLCGKIQDYTATANTYAYSPNAKPHAVRRYYNGLTNELYNLLWDANGNLAQQTVYSVNNNVPAYQNMRALYWDENDRLNLVAGDGYLSYYAYGHDGNRAIKMTGNAAIDQTGTLLNSTNLENITIYPNEYLTVTQAEYTKYYYAGGNRIASKIGTGGFEKMTRLCTLDQSLSYNANVLFDNVIQQIVSPINQPNDEFPVDVCSGYSVATELLTNPLPDFYISNTALNFVQNNLLQQFRQNLAGGTEAVYYFHSDHLGSASWISDGTGAAVQHLQYLPFGEHFVNERSAAYDERFTFTGKERDAETGYYYHGARFNSSDLGWLSVDPMSDKYPSLTPYNYCAWNPVKLVDPEGMEIEGFSIDDQGNVQIDKNIASKDAIRIYEAMSKTETGTEAFKGMINRRTKITLILTKKAIYYDGIQVHGLTEPNNEDFFDNGEFKSATITISTAEIKNNKNDRYNGFSKEEKINGIGTHESVHLDPLQIKIDKSSSLEQEREQEQEPVKLEYKSRLEYREKYGNKNDRDIKSNYINFLIQ
jgi:RHS repeat-associated protein